MYQEVLTRQPVTNPHPTPLLFVHGGFHSAWYWTHFLDYFAARGYADYAPSLRGHGGSEGREHIRSYRICHYVEDVAQVAAELSNPPVVIGHSMGCYIVLKYLETQPVAAGILLAPSTRAGLFTGILCLAHRHIPGWLKPAGSSIKRHKNRPGWEPAEEDCSIPGSCEPPEIRIPRRSVG